MIAARRKRLAQACQRHAARVARVDSAAKKLESEVKAIVS